MTKVCDAMTPNPAVCASDATLQEVAPRKAEDLLVKVSKSQKTLAHGQTP